MNLLSTLLSTDSLEKVIEAIRSEFNLDELKKCLESEDVKNWQQFLIAIKLSLMVNDKDIVIMPIIFGKCELLTPEQFENIANAVSSIFGVFVDIDRKGFILKLMENANGSFYSVFNESLALLSQCDDQAISTNGQEYWVTKK